ncbi:unnamed protein product, partial [Mesorhabditis belari]|uniref:Uncharacterized protein n=1 Tax=Mesorhabditis belari TaxID=2138241 RepID=A0AAF3ED00_9BILA
MNYVEIGNRKIFVSLFVNVTFISQSDFQPFYKTIVFLECLFMSLILIFASIYTHVFLQSSHFHLNLRRLYLAFTLTIYPSLLGRAYIILVQFNCLPFPGPIPLRLLCLFATYGRIIMIVWEVLFVSAVVIERAAATLWIDFYESMQFTELSTLLIVLKMAISLITITLITQLMYEWYFLMLFTLMPVVLLIVILSFMLYHALFVWNVRQLNKMKAFGIQKEATERYLSTRFQLEENVNALTLIRAITLFHAFCAPFCALFLAIPFYYMDLNTDSAQILLILFDLSIAVTTLAYFVIVFFSVEPWRFDFVEILSNFSRVKALSHLGKRSTLVAPIDVVGESEKYFQFYANAWN